MDFGIAEKLVAVHFKAVEHFAAQGQDGLVTLVARQFGRATRAVAFYQEQFVFADVFAFAVGQFAGQHRHAATFFLLDFFHGTHPRLRLLNRQIRNFFADFGVLVEPQFQRVAAHGGHEFERVAVGELVFGLPLELRVEHAGGEHEGGAGEHVVAVDFHAARQQVVVGDEIVHRIKCSLLQARFVRAAQGRGNQIDIAFIGAAALFQPSERKCRAFARAEIVVVAGNIVFGGEHGHGFLCIFQQIRQIALQALRIMPGLGNGVCRLPFDMARERHGNALQQHGFGAQQAFQFENAVGGAFKIFRVRINAYFGAGIAHGALADLRQRLDHITVRKHDAGNLPVTLHGHFQPRRERVGHGHAHAVQAARKGIRAAARFFVELAAGVKLREHEFHHGNLLHGVQAGGNAAPVVAHGKRAVRMDFHVNPRGKTAQGFVCRVVDDFLADVGGAVGAGVHARPFFDGVEAF